MTSRKNVSFSEFLKTAASTCGAEVYNIPAKMSTDAYALYQSFPESVDRVKLAYTLYKATKPGMDKVAMKMVATNILAEVDDSCNTEKDANVIESISSKTNKVMLPAFGIMSAKYSLNRSHDRLKPDNIYQHSEYVLNPALANN